MALPIPATAYQGLVRPHGSQLLEFCPPHRPPQIVKLITERMPNQEQFMTNQCWAKFCFLLGEMQGPKRHQIPKSTKMNRKSAKWSIHRDPNLETFH